jgi:quercetin dioxygenase-like cupin family protein
MGSMAIRKIVMDEIVLDERAARFEGRDHGASVSFFLVRFPPGGGPRLHRHPYDETFLVMRGAARFTVDGETVEVQASELIVAPAGSAHTFVATGDEDLHLIAINPSDHMVQEWDEQ